jgi:uncharacterized membrane protein SpoIIM required for sporulation
MSIFPKISLKRKQFLFYFFIVSIVMLLGIGLGLLHGFISQPATTPLNQTDLALKYAVQVKYIIPQMQKVFTLLSLFNIGVAMLILIFPLYWVWVAWFSHNILTPTSVPMKITVYFLILAVGHNTFLKTYGHYKTFPFSIFINMYFFHAFFEILAYIMAGTFSLLCIDAVRKLLEDPGKLRSADICVFLFHKIWRFVLITIFFVIIGAFVECFITPELVRKSMEVLLQ